jgi:hypothetical protein
MFHAVYYVTVITSFRRLRRRRPYAAEASNEYNVTPYVYCHHHVSTVLLLSYARKAYNAVLVGNHDVAVLPFYAVHIRKAAAPQSFSIKCRR